MTLEGASACSSVFVKDAKSLVWSVSCHAMIGVYQLT
jgi:hypothetical protein